MLYDRKKQVHPRPALAVPASHTVSACGDTGGGMAGGGTLGGTLGGVAGEGGGGKKSQCRNPGGDMPASVQCAAEQQWSALVGTTCWSSGRS